MATLIEPLPRVARLATEWQESGAPVALSDEIEFLQALGYLDNGEESAFFSAMKEVSRSAGAGDGRGNMARHARWIVRDPAQNPYAAYERARSADTRQRTGWLLLGSFASGPPERGLPRPLEWFLSAPGYVTRVASLPGRLIQYPQSQRRFGGGVRYTGERYLARYPNGEHAEEVRAELEDYYRGREQWGQALTHHKERAERDPEIESEYREKIADRTLSAARLQGRRDVSLSMYRSVVTEYPETAAAEQARLEIRQLLEKSTPQQIRLSREFLREHPEVAGSGGLGLRRELLDGDEDNGEVAAEGVTLLGRTVVRIPLESGEVKTEAIPPEPFARFVALLEEASYRRLITDPREQFQADPRRDQFLERARLGVAQVADARPSARSNAVFESTQEKFGGLYRAESILPVELVLRGGLEELGLSAFPRVKVPKETSDAILYK